MDRRSYRNVDKGAGERDGDTGSQVHPLVGEHTCKEEINTALTEEDTRSNQMPDESSNAPLNQSYQW